MRALSRKLDALVNRRNNIAHGGREQALDDSDIEDNRSLVRDLMEALERVLEMAIQSASFRRTHGQQATPPTTQSPARPTVPEGSTPHHSAS